MRLLYKTILISLAVVAFFSVAIYSLSSYFLTRSYEKLENETTLTDLSRVRYAFDDRLYNINKSTIDWAVSDDSYNFVKTPYNTYLEQYLSDDTLSSSNYNFVAYFNLEDQLVYYKYINIFTLDDIPISPQDVNVLVRFAHSQTEVMINNSFGIVQLDSGPLMMASYSIFHGNGMGMYDGILLKGRLIDINIVQDIAHSTELKLSLQPFNAQYMQGLSGESLFPLGAGGDYYIYKQDSSTLNAYKIIDDFTGRPALVAQIKISRDISGENRNAMNWLRIIMVSLSIVFVFITSYLIYRLMVARIITLTRGLQKVADNNDLTVNMPVSGKDEISTLGRQTNSTLQKIAEAQMELKVSEDRFRRISEVTQDIIYQIRLKPSRIIEYISPSVEKTMGYSVDEVMQDPGWVQKIIHADDRAKLFQHQEKWNNAGGLIFRWIHKDGHIVWMDLTDSMVKDDPVGTVKIIGVARDITERITLENHLVDLYQKEKEIRQELEKEAKARGYFIDVLGHELKTPLTPLLLAIDMLKDKIDSAMNPLEGRLISTAADSIKLLTARLDELLDLARFARGTFKLQKQTFEIQEYLRQVISRFQPVLDARHQDLTVEIPENMGIIKADPFRLEQVITNLLSNAGKYSEEGDKIIFRANIAAEMLNVEVEDHGIGISLEEQSRLFEPYHRVEQDRQRFVGLGLGLSVARQIVEAHGGTLSVTSQIGKGSVFKYTIPLDTAVN